VPSDSSLFLKLRISQKGASGVPDIQSDHPKRRETAVLQQMTRPVESVVLILKEIASNGIHMNDMYVF
jgi:hypothetical protein